MEDARDPRPAPELTPERAPYAAPAIAWEEALDARPNLMAACGKTGGISDECNAAPSS
jgi:hypothetical protein